MAATASSMTLPCIIGWKRSFRTPGASAWSRPDIAPIWKCPTPTTPPSAHLRLHSSPAPQAQQQRRKPDQDRESGKRAGNRATDEADRIAQRLLHRIDEVLFHHGPEHQAENDVRDRKSVLIHQVSRDTQH